MNCNMKNKNKYLVLKNKNNFDLYNRHFINSAKIKYPIYYPSCEFFFSVCFNVLLISISLYLKTPQTNLLLHFYVS